MPIGPKGEKRLADVNARAVMIARIATGEELTHYRPMMVRTRRQRLSVKGGYGSRRLDDNGTARGGSA
jgi:hypothetical protein